jgi:hypothetical protein
MPPASAALAAAVGYAAVAAGAAAAGARWLRQLPAPLPAETTRQAGQALAEADAT